MNPKRLHSAISLASEELFQFHLNIIRLIDGHVFVGQEPFIKTQNYNKSVQKQQQIDQNNIQNWIQKNIIYKIETKRTQRYNYLISQSTL